MRSCLVKVLKVGGTEGPETEQASGRVLSK